MIYTATNQTSATARFTAISAEHQVAFALHAALEVITEPQHQKVPGSKPHCIGMMTWQNRWIPIIDLHALATQTHANPDTALVMVLAYKQKNQTRNKVGFSAIRLHEAPQNIPVDNSMQSQLAHEENLWQPFASSCFSYHGKNIPIISTEKLFAV